MRAGGVELHTWQTRGAYLALEPSLLSGPWVPMSLESPVPGVGGQGDLPGSKGCVYCRLFFVQLSGQGSD